MEVALGARRYEVEFTQIILTNIQCKYTKILWNTEFMGVTDE